MIVQPWNEPIREEDAVGWLDRWLKMPTKKTDPLEERVKSDRDWLNHCLAAGAEWRGLRCAECNRPLPRGYRMRVSEQVIDCVCLDGCEQRREAE